MAKETAEQKLLRLIEQSDETGASAAPQPSNVQAQQALSAVQSVGNTFAVPSSFQSIIESIKNAVPGLSSSSQGFSVRDLNKLLILGTMLLIFLFVSSVLGGIRRANQIVDFERPKSVSFAVDKLLPGFPDLERYVSAVSFRNIFHPFEKKEVLEAASDIPQLPQQLAEKTKNLRLVGISWLDTPESASAMVENTDSGVTYFLKSGQKVNGLLVNMIYADSVVLELDGEQMELKL